MLRGGTIIRLIDVVLIILLGFLGITDFEIKSQIKLPSAGPGKKQEMKQQIVYLNIENSHKFILSEGQNNSTQIDSVTALERIITVLNTKYVQDNKRMVVVIEPGEESVVQTTVDVMDICEKYQIPKSLSYAKINLN